MENGFKSRNRGFLPTAGERTISEAVLATGVLDNVLCGLSTAAPTPPPPAPLRNGPISSRLGFQPDSNPRKQPLLLAPVYRSHLRKVTKMPQRHRRSSSYPSFPKRRTKIRLKVPLCFVRGKHAAHPSQHRPWTLLCVKSTHSCHFTPPCPSRSPFGGPLRVFTFQTRGSDFPLNSWWPVGTKCSLC